MLQITREVSETAQKSPGFCSLHGTRIEEFSEGSLPPHYISYQRYSYQIVTLSQDLLLIYQLPSYPQLHFEVFLFIHILVILSVSSLILRQTCVFNLARKKVLYTLEFSDDASKDRRKAKGLSMSVMLPVVFVVTDIT